MKQCMWKQLAQNSTYHKLMNIISVPVWANMYTQQNKFSRECRKFPYCDVKHIIWQYSARSLMFQMGKTKTTKHLNGRLTNHISHTYIYPPLQLVYPVTQTYQSQSNGANWLLVGILIVACSTHTSLQDEY
jgi:hypothetical protein